MAEYIERGALLKHKMPVYGAYDSSLTFEAVPVPYIKGAPIANVQEVRHGKWLVEEFDINKLFCYIQKPYDGYHGEPFCSICRRTALMNGAEEYVDSDYCPHCGAKMDKECEVI